MRTFLTGILAAAFVAGLAYAGDSLISTGAAPVNGAAIAPLSIATGAGDVTLSNTSDLNMGNAAGSAIRAGSGIIELGDHVGASVRYTANCRLDLDATNAALTMAAGRFTVQGDTSSPVRPAFRLVPQDAEPTGANVVGDMYVTTAGVLKICTVAGTPGTWVSVGAQ